MQRIQACSSAAGTQWPDGVESATSRVCVHGVRPSLAIRSKRSCQSIGSICLKPNGFDHGNRTLKRGIGIPKGSDSWPAEHDSCDANGSHKVELTRDGMLGAAPTSLIVLRTAARSYPLLPCRRPVADIRSSRGSAAVTVGNPTADQKEGERRTARIAQGVVWILLVVPPRNRPMAWVRSPFAIGRRTMGVRRRGVDRHLGW